MRTRAVNATAEELAFARNFMDPVYLYEVFWGHRAPEYLKEILRCEDPDIEVSGCPATLKTCAIAVNSLHKCLTGPVRGKQPWQHLVTAPVENHLALDWAELVNHIERSQFLKAQLRWKGIREPLQRDPTWEIYFANGSVIHFRIAGQRAGRGRPLYGLHVHGIDVDEAEAFPLEAVTVLDTRGLPGCQRRVMGMVDGNRDGYLYKAHINPDFRHFTVRAYDSPLWDRRAEMRALQQWGRYSPEWQWSVEANWNVQSEAPFDLEAVAKAMRLHEAYQPLEIQGSEFREVMNSDAERAIEGLVEPVPEGTRVILAADIGETVSPTNIGVFLLDQPGPGGKLQDRLELRIALHRFEAYERAKVFVALATHYRPERIAIDAGNAGSAVISTILNRELFPGFGFRDQVLPVDFRKVVEMARLDKAETMAPVDRRRTMSTPSPAILQVMLKAASTKWLRDRFFHVGLSLPNDAAMFNEFCTHRLVGNRYTDPQHTIDMLRCYAYGRYDIEYRPITAAEVRQEAPLVFGVWAGRDTPTGG